MPAPSERPVHPDFSGYGWSQAAQDRAAGLPPLADLGGPSGSDDDGTDDTGWLLESVRRSSTAHAEHTAQARRAQQARDEAIRLALRAGVPYRAVGEASGLSRPMLDRIRRST